MEHVIYVIVLNSMSLYSLQSFSIPGSMWLSILGGALFNFWLALFTVALCSALGASVAFIISASLGSVAVMRLIGERIEKWNEQVLPLFFSFVCCCPLRKTHIHFSYQLVNHKQHMFNYMFVLRVLPLPPNWVINLGAPHLEVPLGPFFWATFLGECSEATHDGTTRPRHSAYAHITFVCLCFLFIRCGASLVYPRASRCCSR